MKYKVTIKPVNKSELKEFWLKAWRLTKKDNESFINWAIYCIINGIHIRAFIPPWKPYCYEDDCIMQHKITNPTHGPRYTCQDCGHEHDDCVCKYYIEPCKSCLFKNRWNDE